MKIEEEQYKEIIARISRIENVLINLGGMYVGMAESWEKYLEKEEEK